MYNLNFNQLYYFYVVATHGSIKKACDILHLTQPSISGGIKCLEESLGHKLFDREYRQLKLNKNGEKIYKKAQKIFLLGKELLDDINKEELETRPIISIGIERSIPTEESNKLVSFIKEESNIELNISYLEKCNLDDQLKNNKLDLVFTNNIDTNLSRYSSKKIISDKYFILSSKDSKYCKHNLKEALSSYPCISFERIDGIEKENINISGNINNFELLLRSTERGECLAITKESLVQEALKNKSLKTIGTLENVVFNIWGISNLVSEKKPIIDNILAHIKTNSHNEPKYNFRKCI